MSKMIGITEVLIFFLTILGISYLWMKYHYSYWKRYNVPHIPSKLLFGSIKDIVLLKTSAAEGLRDLYNHEIAKNEPFVGIHAFHQPALLIREPELIKRILIKDFNKFSNRYSACNMDSDTLGGHNPFFLKNPLWKEIRTKLTPVYTSGKMKQMFALLSKTGKDLDNHLISLSEKSNGKPITLEVKKTSALYTADVITSSAFGIEANCFTNPDGEFLKYGHMTFDFTFFRSIEVMSLFFLPQILSILKFKFFSEKMAKFIREAVQYAIDEREKSGKIRNDLIDALINIKNTPRDEKTDTKFEGDVLYGQAATFFTAGMETTSSAMSFTLYELSKNSECQQKLRDEIKEVLRSSNGEFTYDVVMGMPYLNMVLQETLRLYPPLPFLDRVCTLSKDESGYSLEPFSDYLVPNGIPIFIPIYGIQRDPKYYPNPDIFDPERFSPEHKGNNDPMTNLPFGTGPHNCIGERFGLMSAKMGLVNFLRNHCVKPSKNSPKSMKLEKRALVIQAEGGIYCDIIRDPLI